MSITADEIASQPGLWRRAADLAPDALPAPGLDVCAIGCGTSLYMAQAWAALREARGHGRTDAFPASELPAGRAYDVIVALDGLERLVGPDTAKLTWSEALHRLRDHLSPSGRLLLGASNAFGIERFTQPDGSNSPSRQSLGV